MPELPEVETVLRGLEPVLAGRLLARVENRRADLRFALPDNFAERLTGTTVVSLSRRAKYLIAELSSGETLVMHLGMTGRFTVSKTIETSGLSEMIGIYDRDTGVHGKHDHIVFHTGNGHIVTYNDPRRFGFMLLVKSADLDAHPMFAGMGAEPLGQSFDAVYLAARARGKKVNLKSLLMDQRVVAGLGNIYVCEALYCAALSPLRAAKSLCARNGQAHARSEKLVATVKLVLRDAIKAGGSTLRDYRHADGGSGLYQKTFRAYDRAGEPCLRPGCNGVVKRIVQTGRSTFYCPKCQK